MEPHSTPQPTATRPQTLRLVTVGLTLAVIVGDVFATQLLILDAPPWTPRVKVIDHANAALKVALIMVATAWLASWLPLLSTRVQANLLRACVILTILTGPAWLTGVIIALHAVDA